MFKHTMFKQIYVLLTDKIVAKKMTTVNQVFYKKFITYM